MKLNRLALVVAAAGLLATGACDRAATVAPGAPAPAPSAPAAVPERGEPTLPPPLQKVAPPVKRAKKATSTVPRWRSPPASGSALRSPPRSGCTRTAGSTTTRGLHAWLVTTGRNALLMSIEDGRVSGFEAGDAETVVFRFTDGAGC